MAAMFDFAPDPLPLQQSPEYVAAVRLFGGHATLQDDLVILRRRFAGLQVSMLPRCLIPDPEALLQRLPPGPAILSPETPCPDLVHHGAVPVMTPGTVALLNLTRDFDQMRKGMDQKWRNRLRHAEKSGLRITCQPMPSDPGHWLLRAETAQARKLGYRSWPTTLTCAWLRANPGASRLFTALRGKEPIAAMLFLLHGDGATYHVGHTLDAGRAVSAHNLLLWTAMQTLARRGITRIDLGQVDTQNAAGLARFKLGSGARVHRLGGTWLRWRPARLLSGPLARWEASRMN